MTDSERPKTGDVLFLEKEIPELPYPSGYWAVWGASPQGFSVRLLSACDNNCFTGEGPIHRIPWPQLGAFRIATEYAGHRMLAEEIRLDD